MFKLSRITSDPDEAFRLRAAAAQGLVPKVFKEWCPELDIVLKSLPETTILPHELFRLLITLPDRKRRQIILMMEKGVPVALVGLKNEFGVWEPVTQWIIPGILFPAKEDYVARVLSAIGLEMKISWWRMERPIPKIRWMRNLVSVPNYAIRSDQDFEDYWRKTDGLTHLIKSRTRCGGFNLKVNLPNSTEFTIRNWARRWTPKGVIEKPDLPERILAAKYLETSGLFYTFSLLDKDKIAVSAGCLIHNNDLSVQYIYSRVPSSPAYLFELICYWARDKGLKKIDIGGPIGFFKRTSFGEKKNWAPEDSSKCEFYICPFFFEYIRKKSLDLMQKASTIFSKYVKKSERTRTIIPKTEGTLKSKGS